MPDLVFPLQPQRDSNPCRHLESANQGVHWIRSMHVDPGVVGSPVQTLSCCPSGQRMDGHKDGQISRLDNDAPGGIEPTTLLLLVKLHLDRVQTAGRTVR